MAQLLYNSTRNSNETVTASTAVLKGLADDGGLFVPECIPQLDVSMDALGDMSYGEVAYEVMKLFLTDYTKEELQSCIAGAYDQKFDTQEIAPIEQVGGMQHLELFHGPTIAFKDMALSILPYLLTTAARKNDVGQDIVILTATSGDTGKAALAGFADVPGTRIIVFYPKGGVSRIQELQMITQGGDNTAVVSISGNFDHAQTGVKQLFEDKELAKELSDAGFVFSSANSINIGRLVPQVVYYVYACAKLKKNGVLCDGDVLNVAVPTGNFGNILAAYYAKQMGAPIGKLVCASNENKVLYDFLSTGEYDKNRPFILTSSPSMDILVSSNLERLIYEAAGRDAEMTKELMGSLKEQGRYEISGSMKEKLRDFIGGYATEKETGDAISSLYEKTGYVMDTHTAVARAVAQKKLEEGEIENPVMVVSTASPYKFAPSVCAAIEETEKMADEFSLVERLHELSHVAVPEAVRKLQDAQILHERHCTPQQMKEIVKGILGV